MTHSFALAAALVVALSASGAAMAKPCHDAKGKFVACAAAASASKSVCKAANGKFAKCGSPGPITVKPKS